MVRINITIQEIIIKIRSKLNAPTNTFLNQNIQKLIIKIDVISIDINICKMFLVFFDFSMIFFSKLQNFIFYPTLVINKVD